MATGDKLIKLDALKAVYDKQNSNVAPTEASSTASAAHAKGSYFFYGGVLYVATADIASGGTITPNTNCIAATVGGEVSDLKSAITQHTRNLFDPSWLNSGVTKDGDWFSGTGSSWGASVSTFTGEPNTQYTLSLIVKEGNAGAIKFIFNYSDSTSDTLTTALNLSADTLVTITTDVGKTISSIGFSYGGSGSAINKVKNIQLEKGAKQSDYIPFLTARDAVAEEKLLSTDQNIEAITQRTKNLFHADFMPKEIEYTNGVYHATKQKMAALVSIPFAGEANTQYVISSLGKGDAFLFQFVYSDNTKSNALVGGDTTDFIYNFGISTAGKTVVQITATYSGSGTDEIYIKNIQIEKGWFPTAYLPEKTADDAIYTLNNRKIGECVNGEYIYALIHASGNLDNSGWNFYGYSARDVMLSEPIILASGDIVELNDSALQMNVSWIYSDGSFGYTGWIVGGQNAKHMIKANGLHEIMIKRVDGTNATLDEVYNALSIKRNYAILYENYLPNKCFVSIAHRGVSRLAPENTIPAFVLSKELMFNGFETDVCKTADGNFVMCHDETVDRTSNGTGKVSSLTLSQLKELDFGSWFSPDYAGTKIPTFEEMIVCSKQHGITPYIELKPFEDANWTNSDIDALIAIIKKHGMFNNVVFLTYYNALVLYMATTYPGIRIGLFGSATEQQIDNYEQIHATEGIYPYSTEITQTDADNCKNAGIPLGFSVFTSIDQIRNMLDYITGGLSDIGNPAAIIWSIANEQ